MALSGRVPNTRAEGRGPTIWLAGSPDELREWMPLGIAGIVTNTVVLNQYAKQYGTAIELIKAYLDLTDKPRRGIARGRQGFYRSVGSDHPQDSLQC